MNTASRQQIICVGSGMGLENADSREFNNWLLSRTDAPYPEVLYVPTASGESPDDILAMKYANMERNCHVNVLSLFDRQLSEEHMRAFIMSHDLIYVGGGNTANMLAIWDAHRLRPIFREAYKSGIVLSGKSAGAMCWFEGGLTDSFGPELSPIRNTLGFLKGSYIPHFEPEDTYRRAVLADAIHSGELPGGIAVPRGVSLLYEDGELADVIALDPELRAEEVRLDRGRELFQDIAPTKVMRLAPKEDVELQSEIQRKGFLR